MEQTTNLAVLNYSPDCDIQPHQRILGSLGFETEALGRVIPAGGPLGLQIPRVFLLGVNWWKECPSEQQEQLMAGMRSIASSVIVTGGVGDPIPPSLESLDPFWLDAPISSQAFRSVLRAALKSIETRLELREAQDQIQLASEQRQQICRVGIALSSEKDFEALVDLILRTSREMTGADAGTLYLLEEKPQGGLIFYAAQCDSVDAPYQRQRLVLSKRSIAGFAAITGETLRLEDVYQLPEAVDYAFDPGFDHRFGYHTRSMLVVPMRNHRQEVIGVLQLINRKRDFGTLLLDSEIVERNVVPFTDENEQQVSAFASQAAVALDNKKLLENVRKLFAGFIRASVTAIEARDPVTSGHSERVARLTVGLAKTVSGVEIGRWRDVTFSREQLREIEYAGLLHDFGKVGVREHVLVKAKKLYDWKLDEIRSRFHYARKSAEARLAQHKLEAALQLGQEAYFIEAMLLDQDHEREIAELDRAWNAVAAANEPTVLVEDRAQALAEFASRFVEGPGGEMIPLLCPDELQSLTIRRGTFDEEERKEIESHVNHSFNFLIQIPWTKELENIPHIVHAHHEKLNGAGYPLHLRNEEIPIQAKMMTISDIFDALTAQDRPYKPALPLPRALDILTSEAQAGSIDADLLDIFIQKQVYRLVSSKADRKGAMVAIEM